MDFKETMIELIVNQYENAKDILEDFPSDDAVDTLVQSLQESITVDIKVESEDPDTNVDYTTEFDQRGRNSATRDLETGLSAARSKIDGIQSQAVTSLQTAMDEDVERAKQPGWSWETESEDTSMWSAQEWHTPFEKIEALDRFWMRMLYAFEPHHPYIERMFFNNAVINRYPIIKALKNSYNSNVWAWLNPLCEKLKGDNNTHCDYQKTIDREFRSVWADCAALYACSGDKTYKQKCQMLEEQGFTPASQYVDLTSVFVSDPSVALTNLNRLLEISGMREILIATSPPVSRTYGFKYLATAGEVSSSSISNTLSQDVKLLPLANMYTKFLLEQQLQTVPHSSPPKSRKM